MAHTKLLHPSDGLPITLHNTGESLLFKVTQDDSDGRFDYVVGTVNYLGGPPMHIHIEEDEVMHILEGQLTFKVGDETVEASAGDVLFVPRGVPHAFVNLQQTPARLAGLCIPSRLAQFLADMAEVPPGPPDPQKMAEIGRRHGVIPAGPPLAVTLGLLQQHAG